MKQVRAVLALSLAACTSWRVQSRPVPEVLEGKPRLMRLSLRSGQRIELHDAALQGDSVVGYTLPATRSGAQRVAIASAEVTNVEVLRPDHVATAIAVLGITLGVLLLVGAAAASSPSPDTSNCQPASPAPVQA